jgi:hypothetical protein
MGGHRRQPFAALDPGARRSPFLARGRLGTEGSVLSEYAVVVGVCGLAISFAILMMGPALSTAYYQNRQIVIAPTP